MTDNVKDKSDARAAEIRRAGAALHGRVPDLRSTDASKAGVQTR